MQMKTCKSMGKNTKSLKLKMQKVQEDEQRETTVLYKILGFTRFSDYDYYF
jgi:hypothetical protein